MEFITLKEMAKCVNYTEYFNEVLDNPFTAGSKDVPKSAWKLAINYLAVSAGAENNILAAYGITYYGIRQGNRLIASIEICDRGDRSPILTIHTTSKKRRKGVAKFLLAEVSKLYPVLVLEVDKTNQGMLAFLDKIGINPLSVFHHTKTHLRYAVGTEYQS